MPVRSRGSLLAGTATFGLLLAALGCHSSPSDHDSFTLPKQPAQSSAALPSPSGKSAVIAASPPQAVRSNQAAPVAPGAAGVTLQPVPMVQTPTPNREVIASTFSSVSAETSQPSTVSQGGAPGAVHRTAFIPIRTASIAPMPVGTPTPSVINGAALEGGDAAAPGNIVLPPPRPLGAPPVAVVHDGFMPPPHPPYPSVPREFEKMSLPPYVVEPPDILLIQASDRITLRLQRITGQHLVAPDGTVNLGIYGQIRVAGMTLDQVGDAVAARLIELMPGLLGNLPELDEKGKKTGKELRTVFREGFTSTELIKREMQVDVLAYNSKFYYVITDGGGYGQQVYPMPIRGNETVLDAMANINGLPSVANKKRIWVARATRAGQPPKILPVDWLGMVKCGASATNYQLFPGDRVYVDSNNLIKTDTFLSKLLSPVQRVLGVTLLGASTVNAISLGAQSGSGFGGGFGGIR